MKIGHQAEFFDEKSDRKRVGTITDILYQGQPPQPSSVSLYVGMGKKQKTLNLQADQVNEPTHAIRRKEYFSALQGLKAQKRKDAIAGSKQFDNLLIQNAELFVDPGYIDFAYSTAQTDRQKAMATHDILNQARAEAGKALKIENIYNPVRRAENLPVLKDYIQKERPAATGPETQNIAAGNLPMGKNTVLKGIEWLDVSYDEESGKIVLKDGRQFSVAPGEKVEVEQTRAPKEIGKAAAPVSPAGPILPIAETQAIPKSPTKPLSPEMAKRLEQIRQENPEEATRIEKGNVAVGIQQFELERIRKARQMRQEKIFPQPKAQEELLPIISTPESRMIAPTENAPIIFRAMMDLKPQAKTGSLVYLPYLREKLKDVFPTKESFDKVILDLARKDYIQLQATSAPELGKGWHPAEEEKAFLTIPGTTRHIMAIGIRMEEGPEVEISAAIKKAERGEVHPTLENRQQVTLSEFLRRRGITSPDADSIRRALQPDFGRNSQYYQNIKAALLRQGITETDLKNIENTIAPLPQDWVTALKQNRNAHDWMQFISENSIDESQILLAKALLENRTIEKQMETLPATTFVGPIMSASGRMLDVSHYDPTNHIVKLSQTNFSRYSDLEAGSTVIHEIVHGLTSQKMAQNREFDLTVWKMLLRASRALPRREQQIINANFNRMKSTAEIRNLGLTEHHSDVYYAMNNTDEFLAQAFSSKEFQDFLKSIPAMETKLPMATSKTLWDQFIEFVNHILFGTKDHRNLLDQVLNVGGQIMEGERVQERTGKGVSGMVREPLLELSSLPPEIQDNLDALNHPAFPANVTADKNFDPYLAKYRFLIHVTDRDLKRWKEIGVLPFWLAKEHVEFKPFLATQENREEKRSELKTERFKQKEPFTFLKGDILSKTERALIEGDAEGRVWTDAKLTERFNLPPDGIAAYRAVRSTLDGIFQDNLDRAETAIVDSARRTIDSAFEKLTSQIESHKASEQKDVLLDLLKTAHDLPLSDTETTHLANLLGETQAATEKPLKAVKDKLVKIFNEILTEKDKAKLLTDYESAYEKAQAQIGDIRQVIYNALGGDIDQANLDEITKGLVQAYLRTERPANTLKELRAEFAKAKGYFPRDHGRGKYEIFVTQGTFDERGQPIKRTIWNRFYNQLEGTKAYMQMKKDPEFTGPGMEIGVRLHTTEPDSSFYRASLANLQRLTDNSIESLKQKGAIPAEWADAMKFQVLFELADQFKARGAARHFIHRADFLIGGYKTTGLNEVLNDYISGYAGMITKQDAAGEFLEAMKGIPKDKPKLKNYAFQYTENMLRNDENIDRVLGKMRGLVFTYFLGGSLRGGIVNSTQSLTMTIPWLARETGWKGLKAEGLVLGSARDIALNRFSEIERRLLDDALNKGALEAQYINSVISEAGDRFGKTAGKIVTLLAKPFSFFEIKNRQIAALAWFRAKMPDLLKTMSEQEAYNKVLPDAIDFVNRTQFMMTKGNLPNWASGGDIGSQFFRTAYTFRKFNHNYLLSLRNSFRGPDGKVALDVIGRSLAYVVLLGGLPAIPFLDDLLDEWEKMFGQPIRRDIKRNLNVIGGPTLEKMGMMGIPATIGIDISGSLKMGIPFVGTPSENIFGVWSGLGQKFVNAKDSLERGDTLRAIESASPAFLEAILKAYRMTEQGATTPTGKILFDEKGRPIKETAGEGIAQAFGFRPERISEASQTHREFANIESHFADRRNDLYSRFRLATTADERKDVIRDIQRFNLDASKYRGAIPMINASSLRQSLISKPEKKYLLWGAQG
ncbi:MAG: PLxRFG domain-containing protein [Thermodesulfobacteriota bacterium]